MLLEYFTCFSEKEHSYYQKRPIGVYMNLLNIAEVFTARKDIRPRAELFEAWLKMYSRVNSAVQHDKWLVIIFQTTWPVNE